MIADVVIVVAMRYVDKGIKATTKLKELEEHHAEQNREMDKGEKLAQRAKRQQQQKKNNYNNIQQPSKHD